ncbi:MAG: hypothetical protein F9K29_23880 [Hyphomicrobiaceae bacterium]|nr:MAG: hypothetical protein F9K29_23880 [Hyphomicrobiaceae bacterium]
MSDDGDAQRKARQLFDTHVRPNYRLDDIKLVGEQLGDDPAVLRALHARCLAEAQRALESGHHTEARRIGNLARQLQRLAKKAGPR